MRYYHIDAFTTKLFSGNPAGVCMLSGDAWPDVSLMQHIAFENGLSETAFVRLDTGGEYSIRWFAPRAEIFLCGHATLASAYALFTFEGHAGDSVTFQSERGPLTVTKEGEKLTLDFPLWHVHPVRFSAMFEACFNKPPLEVYTANADILFVYGSEQDIISLKPNLSKIAQLPLEGVIVTARGSDCDFVSRCFCPQVGIDEDPVTGSAHTALCDYWQRVLQKDTFYAKQLSPRSGELWCRVLGDRVLLSGSAVAFKKGEILL